ncbi:30S ribosomal protein S5 [bacterium (Candidatus Gribaldobacteria) CG_4_10_14_0_2_um_filter_41_16]|uniref:Small ribosomal subunit protein uS5 n=4 Tax=Candidatus Gribaldobacteria TaxID=2798536 RepID=A0A2M7VIS9_9BACT|nr:MAG: 30S ribosomal protein S5 [bacterium (Candidatus Gribaldobacteria) CG10_big_fil_rev_8_21_14_0_10_41_12]PIV46968.1 MAG: 30S ribosomal protein S5 [bacterium (Candidatus Gribaldobacteria) CG02_land_8_20_14_3_00_41_15]PIX03296.1 MAG: 30S ribosomal protein S5 [bacterium (Candidatus Gribaldobacteria) CG_4_8_14_3_um_filter_42_11]PJA01559.1 MAG: 30S ribosomal protein S5 [bacterium (Candidatus Gribaldobacteria) CG_4_10_14_0_2_um_filter_41_16]
MYNNNNNNNNNTAARGNQGGRPSRYSRPERSGPKSEYDSKVLDLARVTKVTGGGKRMRFRAVVAVGNKKGKIGIGVAKGKDVQQAVEKATRLAQRHIIIIPVVQDTIPHETWAKFGPAQVLLKPQGKGLGLVAGGVVRVICSLSGIKDISSKLLSRSRNKLNIAQATIEALKKLKVKS